MIMDATGESLTFRAIFVRKESAFSFKQRIIGDDEVFLNAHENLMNSIDRA
jgi:hypothetical protein